MAYKTCTKCQTQNGVRSFKCKQCGESFGPAKKSLNKDVKMAEVNTTLEAVNESDSTETGILATVKETPDGQIEQFQFKTHTGADNKVGIVTQRKTYERPDLEIERLMKDPEVCRIYPVPSGIKPEKLTAREQAYQVLGLGRSRAKSLLTIAQMEKYWKTVDWKFVAEVLGEKVVEVEPEKEVVEAGTEEKEE